MNNLLEALYSNWVENYTNSPKVKDAFDKLCTGNDIAEINKKYDILGEAVSEESRMAFNAGFRTAVQLLMGGGQA